jgi:hypothetical protein
MLASTNTRGSPDLDLRPSEMQRSTMHVWLQECPRCGFVNGNLSDPLPKAKEIINSAQYLSLSNDPGVPRLAGRFARFALLNKDDPEVAGLALLKAAWVCDDEGEKVQAEDFRCQAADRMLELRPFADDEDRVTPAAVLIDILRRAGRFDEAKSLIESIRGFSSVTKNEVIFSVLNYQDGLCDRGDTKAHTVADAAESR